MRNFWLEANVDGRETLVTGGPRCKDGGMTVKLYVRNEGCSELACTIRCRENNGELTVDVIDDCGQVCHGVKTKR